MRKLCLIDTVDKKYRLKSSDLYIEIKHVGQTNTVGDLYRPTQNKYVSIFRLFSQVFCSYNQPNFYGKIVHT